LICYEIGVLAFIFAWYAVKITIEFGWFYWLS